MQKYHSYKKNYQSHKVIVKERRRRISGAQLSWSAPRPQPSLDGRPAISAILLIIFFIVFFITFFIIIITRPKPGYGRQGLPGVSLRASRAQLMKGKVLIFCDTHRNTHFITIHISPSAPSFSSSSPSSLSLDLTIDIIIFKASFQCYLDLSRSFV